MIHAFLKPRSRTQQAATFRKKKVHRRQPSTDSEGMERVFIHKVDMSRVRPLTDHEWSLRLKGESRFAAWMGIYGIVIGVLLGWFLATLHVIAKHEPAPAPMTKPVASPAPKVRVEPEEEALKEVEIEPEAESKFDPSVI
jgi:hypothetical protein